MKWKHKVPAVANYRDLSLGVKNTTLQKHTSGSRPTIFFETL